MIKLTPAIQWRLPGAAAGTLDARLLPLLNAIAHGENLGGAVAKVGLSYRHGWSLLQMQAKLLGAPLVEMQRGKSAKLSPAGRLLLDLTTGTERRLLRKALPIEFSLPRAEVRAQARHLSLYASHDLALIELCQHIAPSYGLELNLEFKGSLEALAAFAAGHADLAGFHFPLGSHPGALAPYHRFLNPRRHRLIAFIEREQGLMLPPGNPAQVRSLRDLAHKKLRFVNRQRGSGTRLLFDQLLEESRIDHLSLRGYETEEFTHLAVAATIAAGKADAGFGVKAAALRFGLVFQTVAHERYLLACRSERARDPALQQLREALAGPEMQQVISKLPGYRTTSPGAMISFVRALAEKGEIARRRS
jgi:putative molybdopterin biosynthesis protein